MCPGSGARTRWGRVVTVDRDETSNPLIAAVLAAPTFAACGDDDDDTPGDSGATEITTDAPPDDTSGGTETTAMGAEITMPGSVPEMDREESAQLVKDALAGLGIDVTDDQVNCVIDGAEEAGVDPTAQPDAAQIQQMMDLYEECGIDFASAAGG